jgi:hypothetical protein
MDLVKTEARNDCAGEVQQQFNRSKRTSLEREKVCRQIDQTKSQVVVRHSPLIGVWKAEQPPLFVIHCVGTPRYL